MPSRLSSSAPRRATSAGTLRMTIGPIATWSSRASAAIAPPLAVATGTSKTRRLDLDARPPRVLGGQHHRGSAGVEQEGHARGIDPPGNCEFAAEAPVDDDFAASFHLRFRRKEFARDSSDNGGSLEAIGVDTGHRDEEERPGHGRSGEARNVAWARRTQAAEHEPQQKRHADRGAGELLVVQPKQHRLMRREEQRAPRAREKRNGQDEAH